MIGSIFLCILLYLINSVNCWNTSEKYMSMDANNFETKKSRLITFNTEEDGDITVDVEFVVPFIKIPVKKSLAEAKGAIANINLGAVVLAGVLTFVLSVVMPTILAFLNKKLFAQPFRSAGPSEDSYKPYRNTGGDSLEIWRYLTILDNALMENNIDTTSCMQRIICWIVKKASTNVSKGQGTSTDKILDGLATNGWLQTFISNTPFHSALMNGLSSDFNCSREYNKCKVTQRTVNTFTKNFVKIINGG